MERKPGFLSTICQLLSTEDVPEAIRQSASVAFKNGVFRHWPPHLDGSGSLVPEEEKVVIRSNLLNLLLQERQFNVVNQMTDAFALIVFNDWPDRMPSLAADLARNLQHSDGHHVQQTLYVIRYVLKRYQFKPVDGRPPVDMLLESLEPPMYQLMEQCAQSNAIEAAQTMRLLLKSYFSAVAIALSGAVANPESLNRWCTVIHHLLQKRLPEASEGLEPAGQPTDPMDRYDWPWWKCKKWAMRIMTRFMMRYADQDAVHEFQQPAANFLRKEVLPQVVPTVIGIVDHANKGGFVTRVVLHYSMQFLQTTLEKKDGWPLIRPHLDLILFDCIFPVLCFNEDDDELWHSDPEEFIRSTTSDYIKSIELRVGATDFLHSAVKHRAKTVRGRVFDFLVHQFQEYAATDPSQRHPPRKDGLLFMLGVVHDQLMKSERFRRPLEGVLLEHVIPELESPVPYLRFRACWSLSQFAAFPFSDPNSLVHAVDAIFRLFHDPELPVRFMAVASMFYFTDRAEVQEVMRPHLHDVIARFFEMMKGFVADEVVLALRKIVEVFAEDLVDVVEPLLDSLLRAFHEYSAIDEEDEDTSDCAELSAMGCMETMVVLIGSLRGHQQVLRIAEEKVIPLMVDILTTGENLEFFEQVVELMSALTMGQGPVSPAVWHMFSVFAEAVLSFAPDFMAEVMPVLDRVIVRDPEGFLTRTNREGKPLLEVVWAVHRKMETDMSEDDQMWSARLLCTVLGACKGHVDDFARTVVRHCLSRYEVVKHGKTHTVLSSVIGCALLYNAQLTVAELESLQATHFFFNALADSLKEDNQVSTLDMKIASLALLAILQIPPNEQPSSIRQELPRVLELVVATFRVRFEEEENSGGEEEEEEDPGWLLDQGVERDEAEEDNDATHEDLEYLEFLRQLNATKDEKGRFILGESLIAEVASVGDDASEDLLINAPSGALAIQQVDSLITYHDTLLPYRDSMPELFEQMMGALPTEVRDQAGKLFEQGQSKREAEQSQQHG